MEEKQYKEPPFKISPKTGKILLSVLFVLRIVLVVVCVGALFKLLGWL